MVKILKTGALAFAFAALLALAGCGHGAHNETPEASLNDTGDAQMKVVTDAYGRTVEVPAEVSSAATVGSGARFVVYAGGQDKLIAVTEMETDPGLNRPYTMAFASLFESLPATSNGNHLLETSVNTEELLNLNPDVIISSRSAQECDQLQDTLQIPVIGISYQNQLFSENVYNSIQCVAEALDTEDHGQAVIAKMQQWEIDLKARTAAIPASEKPSVYVGGVNYKGAKSWGGTYGGYAPFVILGANNVADSTDQEGAIDVSLEQLVAWDPDFMFLNAGNFNLLKEEYDENTALFNAMKAFQEDHLYTQPFYNFNGTNIDTGICDTYFIGATIYPDAFADVDLEQTYKEIYETLLDGFDFYALMKENAMGFKAFPSLD